MTGPPCKYCAHAAEAHAVVPPFPDVCQEEGCDCPGYLDPADMKHIGHCKGCAKGRLLNAAGYCAFCAKRSPQKRQ